MKTTAIYDFISSKKYKDRDREVIDLINEYFRNNALGIADGLVNTTVVFGDQNREKFYMVYRTDEKEYKEFYKKNRSLIKNEAVNDYLYLLLFTSFCDTNDVIFLDMLSLIEMGSKFKKFFKYGVSNPAKMSYVLEHLNERFNIKKFGAFFLMVQNQNKEMLKSGAMKSRFKNAKLDENYNYIISRISTNINLSMRRISEVYYSTSDDVIYSETSVTDNPDDTIDLANNSIMINNLLYMAENYNPSSLDADTLKVVMMNTPIKKALLKHLLIEETDKKYFYRIAKIFVDYYVENESTDLAEMKKGFVIKSINGRPNNNELKVLEKDIYKDIDDWIKEYKNVSSDKYMEGLKRKSEVVKYVRKLKHYCIIKTRSFLNEL